MPGSATTPGRSDARADAPERIAFRPVDGVGTRDSTLSRLNGWPMRSPADASPQPSRTATHGAGPMLIANPSSYRTLTDYSLPVSRRTNCSASVMGLWVSSPRVTVTSPKSCFCSWSARSCHTMPSERTRSAHLKRVLRSEDRSRHYLRLDRLLRPGDGTSGKQGRSALLQTAPPLGSRPQRPPGPSGTWSHPPTCDEE